MHDMFLIIPTAVQVESGTI